MSTKNYCSSNEVVPSVNVNVSVDVPKIVKYCCVTGVLIVGIIYGTRCFREMLERGFFENIKK